MGPPKNLNDSIPSYRLVQNPADIGAVTQALDNSGTIGLDLETTGLDPRRDRVRLLTLATETIDGGIFCWLIDCFTVDPSALWERLADKNLVIHNAAFDLGFLARLGFIPNGTARDTMLLAQILAAGTNDRSRLTDCCQRYLGRTLDKTGQTSDWSGELTGEQLAYAALDAAILVPLDQTLTDKITGARLVDVAAMELRCLPAMVWMAGQGVALDAPAWQSLGQSALEEAARLEKDLIQTAPSRPGTLFGESWNWDSPPQVVEALVLAGCPVTDSADETLAAVDHPLAAMVRRYRLARKRFTTYGPDWLAHVRQDGRVYPGWRQIGASSGRMACSQPNMQQMPRGEYRRCIVAPPGRLLVKADYSQIELRIAAKITGDHALLEAYRQGEDLHQKTAVNVLGSRGVSKEHRQLAKALNFGLLYGMGKRGFRQYALAQYGLKLTEEDAGRYRDAFFRTYPGLAAWHRRVRAGRTLETRTLAGRRQLMTEKTPDTIRLNSPVQGTGADGVKLALALLWERRELVPGAVPVLAVHDELVIECGQEQAEGAAAWVKSAMLDAMTPLIDPVPVEVEVKVARTWGGD